MFPVLIQSLILASGGLVSVGSITIVILLLISDKGWRNGLGYMLGYVSAYTIIGVTVVTLSYNYTASANASDNPNLTMPILFIIMGCLLLWISQRNWRKKPASEEKKPPRFFAILDKITPLKAFLFGAAISIINFKNLAIFLSAISVILTSDLVLSSKIMIVLLDIFVFCASVILPVAIYLLFPSTAEKRLNWMKQSLDTYSRPISIWLPLIFGLLFLMRGITGVIS